MVDGLKTFTVTGFYTGWFSIGVYAEDERHAVRIAENIAQQQATDRTSVTVESVTEEDHA